MNMAALAFRQRFMISKVKLDRPLEVLGPMLPVPAAAAHCRAAEPTFVSSAATKHVESLPQARRDCLAVCSRSISTVPVCTSLKHVSVHVVKPPNRLVSFRLLNVTGRLNCQSTRHDSRDATGHRRSSTGWLFPHGRHAPTRLRSAGSCLSLLRWHSAICKTPPSPSHADDRVVVSLSKSGVVPVALRIYPPFCSSPTVRPPPVSASVQ